MIYLTLLITGVTLASLERLPGLRFRRAPLFRRFFASDMFYLLTGFVAGTSLTYSFIFSASQVLGSLGAPRLSTLDVPLGISGIVALIAIDFGNYAAHWLLHRYDALWEIHKVHHSSRLLDWLSTFRSHILEQFLRRVLAPLMLVLIGVPLDAVALGASVFYAWAMLIHSNLSLNLRKLEPILVTPRLHRLHHDSSTANKNLGTVFTIWDRMLGTSDVRESSGSVIFGVPGEVGKYPQGWWAQFIEPFRVAARFH